MLRPPHPLLLLLLAILAAPTATAAEWVHLQAGIWALPDGEAFPLWITAVYFPAMSFLVFGWRWLEIQTGALAAPRPSAAHLAGEGLLVVLLFALPTLPLAGPTLELWLTLGLSLFLLLRLAFLRQPGDLLVAGDLLLVCTLIAGDLVIESTLLSRGLYRYPGAGVLALPLWAPLLWAALGLSLRRLLRGLCTA